MTKITGPLMSMDASGSVGGTITFAKWKGRPYARMLVKPANPKSAAQTAQRAMMRYLAQAWATLTTLEQASWQLLADAGKYSPFNAFVSLNLDRWTQNLAPIPEPTPGPNPGGTPASFTATAGVKQVTIQIGGPVQNTGVVVYRSTTTGFTPTKTDVIAVRSLPDGGTAEFNDPNLVTGETYYYRCATFDNDGELQLYATEISATPN